MTSRRYVPISDWSRVHGRPMRVAILKRRSKDDPDTKSLQVQHDAITRWLNSLTPGTWTCDMRPAEQGGDNYEQIVSAWKGKGQHRLLKQIMARLCEYDIVVVYRMDRFGRNVLTMLTALDEMREAGVRLYSVAESLDTADPSQQFNSGLYALLAQHSSDLTSERIRGNKDLAKELGGWRGGAITYGFRKAMATGPDGESLPVRDAHGYKTLQLDPDEVRHVRDAVRWIVDEGWSVAAVVRRFNAEGVLSPRGYRVLPDGTREQILWTTTALKRILTNPALKGYDVVGRGTDRFTILYVDGRPHRPNPSVLSDERWQALQGALRTRAGTRRTAQEALLGGLIRCHARRANGALCGRPMYGPGTITTNNAAYSCRASNNLDKADPERCIGNSISAKNLHRLVELVVHGIAGDPRWVAALEAAWAAAQAQTCVAGGDADTELAQMAARMADLRAERDAAKSNARRAQIKAQIDEIDAHIAALESRAPQQATTQRPSLPKLTGWDAMSTPQKRNVLTAMIDGIDILPFKGAEAQRGRTFDPSRVRMQLHSIGVFHITRPVDTRPAAVTCPECGLPFKEGSALGVHRRHKHGIPGANARSDLGRITYVCPEPGCDRTTTSAGGMRRHVQALHEATGSHPCLLCDRVFTSAPGLASHVSQSHTSRSGQAPTVCGNCGKVLRGQHGLRVHAGRVHPPTA